MPRKYRNPQHMQRKAANAKRQAAKHKDGLGWARAWASRLSSE